MSLKFKVYGLHKSFGILVLILAGLRLSWRLFTPPPEILKDKMKDWEINLAKVIHACLYFGMFLMPLTGWLMSSAKNFPVSVFGLFTLPNISPPSEQRAELFEEVHELLGYTLIFIISLHVLGALKHHFVNKDTTLRRMLPFGLYALLTLGLISSPAKAEDTTSFTPNWHVIKDQSHIKFISKQMGAEFEGRFNDFNASILFDPESLDTSKVLVSVPVTSADTQSKDRDEKIQSSEWFDAKTYPVASFYADTFEKTGETEYLANGILQIKDVSKAFSLPFTLTIEGSKAVMNSTVSLQRLDWNMGMGEWTDTSFVGNEVKLDIQVTANAAAQQE